MQNQPQRLLTTHVQWAPNLEDRSYPNRLLRKSQNYLVRRYWRRQSQKVRLHSAPSPRYQAPQLCWLFPPQHLVYRLPDWPPRHHLLKCLDLQVRLNCWADHHLWKLPRRRHHLPPPLFHHKPHRHHLHLEKHLPNWSLPLVPSLNWNQLPVTLWKVLFRTDPRSRSICTV